MGEWALRPHHSRLADWSRWEGGQSPVPWVPRPYALAPPWGGGGREGSLDRGLQLSQTMTARGDTVLSVLPQHGPQDARRGADDAERPVQRCPRSDERPTVRDTLLSLYRRCIAQHGDGRAAHGRGRSCPQRAERRRIDGGISTPDREGSARPHGQTIPKTEHLRQCGRRRICPRNADRIL